jgi:hypothetical protein
MTSDSYFVLIFLQEALFPLVFNDFAAAWADAVGINSDINKEVIIIFFIL